MTIVITLISKYCCATASDSLITYSKIRNTKDKFVSWKDRKIFIFSNCNFHGAMAFWGLAYLFGEHNIELFSTSKWLNNKAKESLNYKNPEEFVSYMTEELNKTISKYNIVGENGKGIGIQLCTYENIDGFKIPEMFVIRNYDGTNYSKINQKIEYFRSTYDEVQIQSKNALSEVNNKIQGEKEHRKKVYDYLQEDKIIIFNNGDPVSTNIVNLALFELIDRAKKENLNKPLNNTLVFRNLAKWAVITVSNFQRDFYKQECIKVGGKPHSLSITPNGIFESNTDKISLK